MIRKEEEDIKSTKRYNTQQTDKMQQEVTKRENNYIQRYGAKQTDIKSQKLIECSNTKQKKKETNVALQTQK